MDPVLQMFECRNIRDVIHHSNALDSTILPACHRMKPLLTRGIPSNIKFNYILEGLGNETHENSNICLQGKNFKGLRNTVSAIECMRKRWIFVLIVHLESRWQIRTSLQSCNSLHGFGNGRPNSSVVRVLISNAKGRGSSCWRCTLNVAKTALHLCF